MTIDSNVQESDYNESENEGLWTNIEMFNKIWDWERQDCNSLRIRHCSYPRLRFHYSQCHWASAPSSPSSSSRVAPPPQPGDGDSSVVLVTIQVLSIHGIYGHMIVHKKRGMESHESLGTTHLFPSSQPIWIWTQELKYTTNWEFHDSQWPDTACRNS